MKTADHKAMDRWLAHGPPSDAAKQRVGAKAVVRRLRPSIQAAILDGTTDLLGVHAMLVERGYQITVRSLRTYLGGGSVAEPRRPGSSRRRVQRDAVLDSWVCQVCETLPEEEIPVSVRDRYRQIRKAQAAAQIRLAAG